MDALPFFGLIVVGMGALVGAALWMQYRRNQAIRAWARSIGWTYVGTDPTLPFESEAFKQAWRVRAGVAKFAHDVVHPRVMERLLHDDARASA